MSDLTKGRKFQLWEYHVSHGSLLIRSPAGPGQNTSIDIICVGVEYLAAPRHLGEISIAEATETELRQLESMLCKTLPSSRVWVIKNPCHRFILVAADLKIQEYQGDIFDSPFR
jgi:hypothetical protein